MTQDKDNALLPCDFRVGVCTFRKGVNIRLVQEKVDRVMADLVTRANVPKPEAVGVDVEGLKSEVINFLNEFYMNKISVAAGVAVKDAIDYLHVHDLLSAPVVPDGYVLVPEDVIRNISKYAHMANHCIGTASNNMLAAAPDKRADGGG